jgi:hypothetical protein
MTPTPAVNVFQRLVRSWEAVHPYNAAQAIKLELPSGLAPGAFHQGWHAALESLGLGRMRTDGRRLDYEILNGDAIRYPVRVLPAGTSLADHLSAALNQPFHDEDEPPFRPFLLEDGRCATIGIVYRHWVADSVSIRRLLGEWRERLIVPQRPCAGVSRINLDPTNAAPPTYWNLFGPRCGSLRIEQAALELFRSHMRFRQVLKVHNATPPDDYQVRVRLRALDRGEADAIRDFARRRSMKVGDVLLAALTEAAARCVPMQRRPNRRDVAVGNIIDLRPYAARDLSNTFGLFLGFTQVVCRPGDLRDWDRLLRTISLQNRKRRPSVAQASGAWMIAAMATQRLVPPDNLYRFYRKEMPLAAGLSNVRMPHPWPERTPSDAAVRQYLRISPTGPMAPAVLSVTTFGSTMQLALTYRTALLANPHAEQMLDGIVDRLQRVVE